MHDMDILGLNERVGSLITEIFGDSGLMKRVEILEEIAVKTKDEEDRAHLHQIIMDKQRSGMLRVKELEIRDVERSMLLEKIKDLEIRLGVENKEVEFIKSQPKINHEELERRLDSISQILFCAFEVKKKKELRRAMETSAGALRLLINDIQFPLRDKDIFKTEVSSPQMFHDFRLDLTRNIDDGMDYEGYLEYEEDEDDLG